MDYFEDYRKSIKDFLMDYLDAKEKSFSKVNPLASNALKRLQEFVISGKMLRGSLVFFGYSLFKNTPPKDILKLASAIELFQSSLLIHDDIMDEDRVRRGKPSIFAQYETFAKENNLSESKNFGRNIATCIGDLGFFLGYNLISDLPTKLINKVMKMISDEFISVGLAQMHDLYNSVSSNIPSEEEILNLYKHKTARYTFSLPLSLGAGLAGGGRNDITKLEKIGEELGIIFQIRDDELGILGNAEKIGKPVGSDITQNKKTLYYVYLFRLASKEQKEKLNKIFGKPNLKKEEILFVTNLIHQLKINELVDKITNDLAVEIRIELNKSKLETKAKEIILSFLDYNSKRTK